MAFISDPTDPNILIDNNYEITVDNSTDKFRYKLNKTNGSVDLYWSEITGDVLVASSDSNGNWSLKDTNFFKSKVIPDIINKNKNWSNAKVEEYFSANFVPQLDQVRAQELNILFPGNQAAFQNIPGYGSNPPTTQTGVPIPTTPTGGGILSFLNAPDIFNLAKLNPDDIEKSLKFGEIDEYIKITEQYPLDALYGVKNRGQDYVQITQYKYQPPRRETLFSQTPTDILKSGSIRGSAFKSKEKFIGWVKLPMPNDINDSNNVNWGEDAMNNLSAAITSAVLKNPMGIAVPSITGSALGGLAGIPGLGSLGMLFGLLQNAGVNVNSLRGNPNAQAIIAPTVASRLLAMGQIQVSPESILARGFGIAPNSNLELLFQSPTLREFNFNWKMSPRSEPEAVKIRKIIRFFKQGMAAKKLDGAAGAGSFFLGTPNVFQVEYKTSNNSAIAGLNRIKTCALTGTSVNYTPEGDWASYGDGQPVSIILSLRFQELEPVYDTDYNENVSTDRIDLYPIRPDEVGY